MQYLGKEPDAVKQDEQDKQAGANALQSVNKFRVSGQVVDKGTNGDSQDAKSERNLEFFLHYRPVYLIKRILSSWCSAAGMYNVKQVMDGIVARFVRILSSRAFFLGVLIFFCLQALWIALSAVYPMAFDEEVHFGIIKIYAGQLSPFLSGQPEGADSFGAVARDPSYLYHYLMSFPYRVIAHFTDSQSAQVVVLRLLNIPILALGLVLFRKVLLRARLSPALVNLSILLFTLIPIVPFLGGQINYDNLLLVLVPLLCLFAYDVMVGLKKQRILLVPLVWLVIVFLTASLVKYAFLPIGLAAILFLLVYGIRHFRGAWDKICPTLAASFKAISPIRKVVMGILLLAMVVLFVQRYGVNAVTYHHPVPPCDAVIGEQKCASYGPWQRNHLLAQSKGDFDRSPLTYAATWTYWLWHRMFFVVNGPGSLYATRPPLPLPYIATALIAVSGVTALILLWRQVFRGRAYLGFFLGMIVLYCATLWLEDYSQYLETSQPVAINGRYLLPLVLLGVALIGQAFSYALRAQHRLKAGLAAAAIILFLQGGGAMGFILRSDETWNWQNKTVIRLNNGARQALSLVTFEYKKFY